jgi:hypothetical protein
MTSQGQSIPNTQPRGPESEITTPTAKEFRWPFTVFNLLLGVISLPVTMFAPTACGAPGSCDNILVGTLVLAVFTFPIVCIISVILGWVLLVMGQVRIARIVLWFPRYEFAFFVLLLLLAITIEAIERGYQILQFITASVRS